MSYLGPASAFMSSVTWAFGSTTYTRLARGHSAFAVNFARATVALPLFFLAALATSGGPQGLFEAYRSMTGAQVMWLAISIVSSYGLGDVFFMWSARSLGVPAALAIGSTFPIPAALMGAWTQGEWLSGRQTLGLLIAICGVIAVILSQAVPTPASGEGAHAAPSHLTKKSVGVLLGFAASIAWAFNSLGTARGMSHLNPMVGNTLRMTFALAMTAGFGQTLTPGTELTLPWKVTRKSLPIFVLEAFGGSAFFSFGLSHSTLAVGSTLSSLAPVLAVPIAWFLKTEKFSLLRTVGVFVVFFGLWLLLN